MRSNRSGPSRWGNCCALRHTFNPEIVPMATVKMNASEVRKSEHDVGKLFLDRTRRPRADCRCPMVTKSRPWRPSGNPVARKIFRRSCKNGKSPARSWRTWFVKESSTSRRDSWRSTLKTEIIQKRGLPFLLVMTAILSAGCASTKWCDCARRDGPNLSDTRIFAVAPISQPAGPLALLAPE